MVNSDSPVDSMSKKPSHPLVVLLLSLVVFILLDNLVFRTALYSRFIPPVTTSARLARFVLGEEARPASGKDEILATGASVMQFGLWPAIAEQSDPDNRFRVINAGIWDSSEKWTYYILKRIDPTHRRYKAIVISSINYRIPPWPESRENMFNTAQAMAPFVPLRDWPVFDASFTDPDVRHRVTYQGLFTSRGVGMDVMFSAGRVAERILKGGPVQILGDEGPPENVVALRTTPDDGSGMRVITYPPHFDIFVRRNADLCFRYPSPEDGLTFTRDNAHFLQSWLTRIILLYRDSPTRLIFVQMPRWPVPLPRVTPIASAPDIRDLLPKQKNLMFVDENEFKFLEKPQYFVDLYHLNRMGRRAFSQKLGVLLRDILYGSTPALQQTSGASLTPVISRR